MFALHQTPHLSLRLHTLQTLQSFPSQYTELHHSLTRLAALCSAITTSPSLTTLLVLAAHLCPPPASLPPTPQTESQTHPSLLLLSLKSFLALKDKKTKQQTALLDMLLEVKGRRGCMGVLCRQMHM